MDDIGFKLCTFQAQLFEESKNYFSCSSPFFIKIFMNSSLATRIDNKNFIFESIDLLACYKEININNIIEKKNVLQYPGYILSWIGYLYRYACYEYDISSKRIYNIIKPKELFSLYEAYHSLDTSAALKRIFESKNIDINNLNYSKELAYKIFINN